MPFVSPPLASSPPFARPPTFRVHSRRSGGLMVALCMATALTVGAQTENVSLRELLSRTVCYANKPGPNSLKLKKLR